MDRIAVYTKRIQRKHFDEDSQLELINLYIKIHEKIEVLEKKVEYNPYDDTHALPELKSLLEQEK